MIFDKNQLQELNSGLLLDFNELEIRFTVQQPLISNYFAKIQDKPTIINSIALITQDNCRRESFYVNGKKTHHEDVKKENVKKIILEHAKISFAKETKTAINLENLKCIRFKKRYRFEYDYILDFTLVKVINARSTKILENALNFFETAKASESIKWELEVEFPKKTNVNQINSVLLNIYSSLNISSFFKIIIEELYDLVNRKGETVKQFTNNPIILDRNVFKSINLNDYLILEKSDGIRCLLKLGADVRQLIAENKIIVSEGQGTVFDLFDCEYLDGVIKIFDIILQDCKPLSLHYEERLELIKKLVGDKKDLQIKEPLPVTCENLKLLLQNEKTDGIIFNEKRKPYYSMTIYKWKPADLITFDFLIVPMKYKGTKPFISDVNIYILMTGCFMKKFHSTGIGLFTMYKKLMSDFNITLGSYNPVPFSPPLWKEAYIYESPEVYSLCVGEFKLEGKNWKLVKIREDKNELISKGVYGNDYFVALQHFNEVQNPLTIEELCEKKGAGYFVRQKNTQYKIGIKFNNFVKFNIMKILTGMERVLDIASGKGQDIFIYNGLGIKKVYFSEPDVEAFIELSKRVQQLKNPSYYIHTPVPEKSMLVELINKSYEDLIKMTFRVDAIVSNFACHYFLKSQIDYQKFHMFCKTSGAQLVILTFFDYEFMKSYLPFKNERYDVYEQGGILYVKHHFSNTHVSEYVVDTAKLIKAMDSYEVIMNDSFGHFLSKYEKLPAIDATYCSFYQYLIFRKSK